MRPFLLLFPPATEATFFPYLSLPALTAKIRMINAEVQQVDLNLNVIKKLLNPDSLDALAYRVIETSSSDERRALPSC